VIMNIFDPDAIVVGGGVSNLDRLYRSVPGKLFTYVFGREVSTPILKAIHGDSS
jgi:fructokinase